MEVSDGLSFYIDNQENPLPHPGEMETLKEKYGYSEREAVLKGRLHEFESFVCKDCGKVNDIYSLYLSKETIKPSSSLENMFIVLALLLFCILFLLGFNSYLNIVLFFLLIILPYYFYDKILRERILKQHSFHVEMNCKKCNSEQFILINDYVKKEPQKMLCEKCGKRESICESMSLS
ncbi:MAG: hypothetical protein ACO3BO_06020 [Anaerohalosphaeraceae bacterium]